MRHRNFPDIGSASGYVAAEILRLLGDKPDAVLSFATSRAVVQVCGALKKEGADLTRIRFVQMFEWAGVPPGAPGSCTAMLRDNLFLPFQIPRENTWMFNALAPDPDEECERMVEDIRQLGGIDYLLTGMVQDGTLALNSPGSGFAGHAHEVRVHQVTREIVMRYFPNGVPLLTTGLTLGLADILAARCIRVVAFGEEKREVVHRLLREAPSEQLPASVLFQAADAELVTDKDSGGREECFGGG